MTDRPDGGPAFPGRAIVKKRDHKLGILLDREIISSGMSIRDWFAGQALAGMLACPNAEGTVEEFASDAYRYADAMLAERATK